MMDEEGKAERRRQKEREREKKRHKPSFRQDPEVFEEFFDEGLGRPFDWTPGPFDD